LNQAKQNVTVNANFCHVIFSVYTWAQSRPN